jgi:hypothetical protein
MNKLSWSDEKCEGASDLLVIEIPHREPPEVYDISRQNFLAYGEHEFEIWTHKEIEECFGGNEEDFEDWPEELQAVYDLENKDQKLLQERDGWSEFDESSPTEFHVAAAYLEHDLSRLIIFDEEEIRKEVYSRSKSGLPPLQWGEGEFYYAGHQWLEVQTRVNRWMSEQGFFEVEE